MFAMMANAADKVTITVKNSLQSARAGEMVEVPFDQVQKKLGGAAQVVVTDADGKTVIYEKVTLDFEVVVVSSPEIVKGQTYNVKIGNQSGSFTAK